MEERKQSDILSEYLTKEDLAAQLNRSIRSLDRWALNGDGPPYVRIGRRILYRREAILEWLKGLETTPKNLKRNRTREGAK
jgi:hypothetical protein